MSRLIDADVLVHELTEMVRHNTGEYKYGIQAARLVVMDAPNVCVPNDTPLRCRTCSFFVSEDLVTGGCSMFGGECTADDYCSRGAWTSNATN